MNIDEQNSDRIYFEKISEIKVEEACDRAWEGDLLPPKDNRDW